MCLSSRVVDRDLYLLLEDTGWDKVSYVPPAKAVAKSGCLEGKLPLKVFPVFEALDLKGFPDDIPAVGVPSDVPLFQSSAEVPPRNGLESVGGLRLAKAEVPVEAAVF